MVGDRRGEGQNIFTSFKVELSKGGATNLKVRGGLNAVEGGGQCSKNTKI